MFRNKILSIVLAFTESGVILHNEYNVNDVYTKTFSQHVTNRDEL